MHIDGHTVTALYVLITQQAPYWEVLSRVLLLFAAVGIVWVVKIKGIIIKLICIKHSVTADACCRSCWSSNKWPPLFIYPTVPTPFYHTQDAFIDAAVSHFACSLLINYLAYQHLRFGPLLNHWTTRFEAKHKYFKHLVKHYGEYLLLTCPSPSNAISC